MSNRSDNKEEIVRKAERDRELVSSKHSLSKGQVSSLVSFLMCIWFVILQLRKIRGSVPENTSENTLLEIIYSCDGDINKINVMVSELWEGGMNDEWETVMTRDERVVVFLHFDSQIKRNNERKERQRAATRGRGRGQRTGNRDVTRSKFNNTQRKPIAKDEPAQPVESSQPIQEVVQEGSAHDVQTNETVRAEPVETVETMKPEETVESAEVMKPVETVETVEPENLIKHEEPVEPEPLEVAEPVESVEPKPLESFEPEEPVESVEPETVPETIPEFPETQQAVVEPEPVKVEAVSVKQPKRIVKKVQRRKPLAFSLGSFASPSNGFSVSFGVQPEAQPEIIEEPVKVEEPKVVHEKPVEVPVVSQPMPSQLPYSKVAQLPQMQVPQVQVPQVQVPQVPQNKATREGIPSCCLSLLESQAPESDPIHDFTPYGVLLHVSLYLQYAYYPGIYPGYPQPHMYFDYYSARILF